MSINDLVFEVVSSGEVIDSALQISSSYVAIRVRNEGETNLTNLGLYISPATNLGDVDYPSDRDPYVDYQDLLTYGTATHNGSSLTGGIKVSCTAQDESPYEDYIHRSNGSTYSNRILILDLDSEEEQEIEILIESPPGAPSRRFYVQFNIDGEEE
jgi:hypothetical protein